MVSIKHPSVKNSDSKSNNSTGLSLEDTIYSNNVPWGQIKEIKDDSTIKGRIASRIFSQTKGWLVEGGDWSQDMADAK